MRSKPEARARSIQLRREGHAIPEIASLVGASQGSVSVWVRETPISEEQKRSILLRAGNQRLASDGARQAKIRRWGAFQAAADIEWPARCADPIFMFGLALYVGEGGKTQPNALEFSNSDPRVIRKALDFYLSVGAPREDIKVGIYMYEENRIPAVEAHWREVTGLPAEQFYKARIVKSRSSGGVRGNTIPNGTVHIVVHSTELRQKVGRWMELALAN